MKQDGGARAVEKLIQTYGCLPATGDGPILPAFDAKALAHAIEQAIAQSADYGWTKVTLHMDLPDARQLAHFLRR